MQGWQIENCVTVIATVACVLGLYWMSKNFNSLWAGLILLNLNYPK